MSAKRFYIEKLGCAKNQVDAEIIASSLEGSGWVYTEEAEEAELIVINSCGFIETAREEAVNMALAARYRYPNAKILFAGCMAQRYGAELLEELPEIDGVFGNLDPERVSEAAETLFHDQREVFLPEEGTGRLRRSHLFSYPGSAYLRISEGCNHWCSYCAIPIIRGELRSRTIEAVCREAEELIRRGIRELNLVAQDLAAFGTDREGSSQFPELLRRLSALEGDFWIRLLYIHPDCFPYEILDIMKEDPRILPYFDIPFQHADTSILKSMGRTGNSESYLQLLSDIRRELPRAVIRSTFMLGYPGEGRRQIKSLSSFIEQAQLDWAGFFVYSREEGTRSAALRGPLGTRLAAKRAQKPLARLQALQESISIERTAARVGQETRVLIEEEVKGEELYFSRAWFQAPEVDGACIVSAEELGVGDFCKVRLRRHNGFDLEAVPI